MPTIHRSLYRNPKIVLLYLRIRLQSAWLIHSHPLNKGLLVGGLANKAPDMQQSTSQRVTFFRFFEFFWKLSSLA